MGRIRRGRRDALLILSVTMLSGCGAAGMLAVPQAASTPESASSVISVSPAAVSPPTISTTAPASSEAVTAMPAPARTPTPQPPALMTFAITPLFPGGAAGTITVLRSSSGAHYHVVVTGLVAHSVHTVHDHAGTCGSANGSRHLAVLATATADRRGVIVFDATVPSFDFGPGRVVIVYDSARPILVTGCAAL
jgi:hypothetical protein